MGPSVASSQNSQGVVVMRSEWRGERAWAAVSGRERGPDVDCGNILSGDSNHRAEWSRYADTHPHTLLRSSSWGTSGSWVGTSASRLGFISANLEPAY